jgi:protein-disulfide isomerase
MEAAMFRNCKIILFLVSLITLQMPAHSFEDPGGQKLGGSLKSPIRMEIFSDFQCPHCRTLYLEVIRQVLQEYSSKDKVCVIYHEFPLPTHKYAREAARYSEAASRIGTPTLLQVFEALYKNQDQWSEDGKLEATIANALPQESFQKLKQIMQDPGVNQAIEKEIQLGNNSGIDSTPTMVIYYSGKHQRVDGKNGPITYFVLKQFIESILN